MELNKAMGTSEVEQLVFVYNANSGIGNALLDSARKILNPDAYDCNLCAITYGVFSENKKWKEFRHRSNLVMEFLHRDDFKKRYPHEENGEKTFPAVFVLQNGKIREFLDRASINAMKDQQDLIWGIQKKLKETGD